MHNHVHEGPYPGPCECEAHSAKLKFTVSWRALEKALQGYPPPCPTCPRVVGVFVAYRHVNFWCIPCGWSMWDWCVHPMVALAQKNAIQYASAMYTEVSRLVQGKHRLDA